MRVFCLFFTLLMFAVPAFGVDLAEMQASALLKREIIKRYQVNLEQSVRDMDKARSGYLPSVDFIYKANQLNEKSLTEDKESSIFYGAVTYNLFRGFRDKYQIASAELSSEVEQLHLNGLQQDIQLDVALIYLEVYERKANLEVALNNYETLQKIYQDGKNRLDAGLIDNNELLRFKVDLDNSELLVDAARAGLEKSVELLGRTIGETVTLGQLGFSEFQQIPAPKDLERNITLMLTERSELLVLDKLTDASRMAMKVEQSEYYPKVDLVGSYTNYDYDLPNNNGSVNEDELRAQLVFSINLYQGGVTEAAVARSRLETLGLQYDRKELSDTLVTDLRNLHTDFTVNLRNVDVALVSIEQAEENLRISRLRYNEGLQRESDLLDAVTNLSRAHYNYVTVVQTVFSNHFRIMRMVESF